MVVNRREYEGQEVAPQNEDDAAVLGVDEVLGGPLTAGQRE
jgi:hypothetical protein